MEYVIIALVVIAITPCRAPRPQEESQARRPSQALWDKWDEEELAEEKQEAAEAAAAESKETAATGAEEQKK